MSEYFARPHETPKHLHQGECVPSNKQIVEKSRGSSEYAPFWMPNVDVNSLPEFSIIDEINDDFQRAIDSIKLQKLISVSGEGVSLSREGILCWLVIMVDQKVFLFDMVSLKSEGFVKGLKEILETGRIEKIIFDATWLNDYLYNVENVKLYNVFDVQAAQVVLWRRLHGDEYPMFFESLLACIQKILEKDVNKIPILWHRINFLAEDEKVWRDCRPLNETLQKVLVAGVMFLADLRRVMCNAMLQDFYDASNIKLKVASEENSRDAGLLRKYPRQCPAAFKHLDDYRNENLAALERTGHKIDQSEGGGSSWLTNQRWGLKYLRYSREGWRANRVSDRKGGKESAANENRKERENTEIESKVAENFKQLNLESEESSDEEKDDEQTFIAG